MQWEKGHVFNRDGKTTREVSTQDDFEYVFVRNSMFVLYTK